MDFKNDKITLSFNNFKKYLSSFDIEVTEYLINTLCHEDYIISNDKKNKQKYICKMKYSEDRIKKASTERLRKRSKNMNTKDKKDQIYSGPDINSYENKYNEFQDIKLDTNAKNISRDNFQNKIYESPCEVSVKSIYENYNDKKINDKHLQNIQTARTSSYLFDKEILITKNNDDKEIEEQLLDTSESIIPNNILDIYEELDIKEQIIEGLEDDISKIKKEIIIKDKKISELIKEIDNTKNNNFNFNKEQLIDILNNLLKKQIKLNENINSFVISVESASPKKINMIVNKNIINIKNQINSISYDTNLINDEIVNLLNC
jgi:predicted RNase H-like nuclease